MQGIDGLIQEIPVEESKAFIIERPSDIPTSTIESLLEAMPTWQKEKILSYKSPVQRRERVLSFTLLIYALRKEYGITDSIEFGYLAHGKPVLRNYPNIFFNMSHCREAVAVIVSDRPVGIDVERRGRYKERLAKRVLSKEEMERVLSAADPDDVFTRYWTIKEAIQKLTGEGVGVNMKNVISDHPEITLSSFARNNYICTVAYLTS